MKDAVFLTVLCLLLLGGCRNKERQNCDETYSFTSRKNGASAFPFNRKDTLRYRSVKNSMVDTISFVLSESIEDYVVTIPEQYIASGICGGAKKKYQRLKYTYKTPDRLRSYSIEIIGEGTDKVYFIVPNSDNTYGGHIFYSSFGWGLDDQSKGSTHNLVTGDFYKCWDFTAEAKWQSTPNYPQYSYTGYVDYEASESNASYNFTHGVVVFSLYENSDSMELYELIP